MGRFYLGIIPARAGFTVGEVSGHGDGGGSSPLARGLRPAGRGGADGRGIIPARAGFTSTRRSPCRRRRDHPRSRGVYDSIFATVAAIAGSSPLARGLPRRPAPRARLRGIIPARAGFTAASTSRPSRPTDHPRSRGVYLVGDAGVAAGRRIIPARAGFTPSCQCHSARIAGSSPLARGLLLSLGIADGRIRIIPARAGFT